MIKTQKAVPEVYYKESRDFQLLGRIFDFALNYSKTTADMVLNNILSKNSDIKLLDLTAKSLGFESAHEYNVTDLYALCKSFKTIIKYKGTIKAIKDCVSVLLKAQDIASEATVTVSDRNSAKPYNISITVPDELTDTIMLEDMLDYIMPAGFTYSIVRAAQIGQGYTSVAAVNPDLVSITEHETKDLAGVHTHADDARDPIVGETYLGVIASGRESDLEDDE